MLNSFQRGKRSGLDEKVDTGLLNKAILYCKGKPVELKRKLCSNLENMSSGRL